jgi:tetratricopeptide (TPR) repeat protein
MSRDLNASLENFDDLFTGDPVDIERNLTDLLAEARALENNSIYLQILSQIALAQAMQQKFEQAHKTLDEAEQDLQEADTIAYARILLERGRVYHQSGDIKNALPLFKQSYELSKSSGLDFHAINAAHMVAIVEEKVGDKIHWNRVALSLAENTTITKAGDWIGVLYNNLAQNYIESHDYSSALEAFEKCKKYAEIKGGPIVTRGAKWGIARSYRSLGRLDEALIIQTTLLSEYEEIAHQKLLPIEIIYVGRGVVYEELALIHHEYMKHYAMLAYQDLSKDPWCNKLIPDRIEQMKDYAK